MKSGDDWQTQKLPASAGTQRMQVDEARAPSTLYGRSHGMRNSNVTPANHAAQSVSQHCSRLCRRSARLGEICYDALVNDGSEIRGEREAEEEQDACWVVESQKTLYQPFQQEWDNRMRTHIPFRKWCPHCVGGECFSGSHRLPRNRRRHSNKRLQ